MDGILDLLSAFTSAPSRIGGGLPVGGLLLYFALSLFGAQLVNGLSHRKSMFHLVVSLSAMLVGALVANMLLAGVHLPLSHELVASTLFALLGMTVAGLALLVAYRRADI